MSQLSREEKLQRLKEKVRKQKEEEARKEREYYKKVTSGAPWLLFTIVTGYCALLFVLTTIDIFVDGSSEKLTENEWRIDRQLYAPGHQSIKVEDALFIAYFPEWNGHKDDSFEIIYSPIFNTGKKLSYIQEIEEGVEIERQVIRRRSIFTWFPYLQIMLLIPILTFFLKAQKPWFTFARYASLFLIAPGSLLVVLFTLL